MNTRSMLVLLLATTGCSGQVLLPDSADFYELEFSPGGPLRLVKRPR